MAAEGRNLIEIQRLGIWTVLTNEHGTEYLVVAVYPRPLSMTLPNGGRMFGLVRIPNGMGGDDLGRRFRWAPTEEDATRPELI